MDFEKELVSYLEMYGNTRESDLLNYGVQNFHFSPDKMKKIVNCMVIKGKIHRLVHNKLNPPEVYVALEERSYPEILKNIVEMKIPEGSRSEVLKILEEAAAIAKKRMNDKP